MYRTSLISNSWAVRFTAILALLALCASTQAQKEGKSPTETAVTFYRALKAKRYLDGFRHSVYRGAVEGLTAAELKDLEPDFARTFAAIPDKIEPNGEQITGKAAVVSLKFGESKELQSVALVRVGNEWLVGDQETLALVKAQGPAFFFNTRMQVNESETYEMLQRIIGAQIIYSRKFEGKNASLAELIRLGGVPKDLEDGDASGYQFSLTVSADEKAFFAAATPTTYGKTGRTSFYADINGIRGEDLKGQPATERSPTYQPK
jgi:hypothetical protein